eukprot:TRINITY_DN45407_c0_g2_i1.p1 TRINITY_DN45407_c0_g2~~TRINITY_DN45407_c0_g2_i1.p1  ORF type:complete len:135 (-),score=11.68 TRINITY_DN45407_c0_g2_i1:27-431(-)
MCSGECETTDAVPDLRQLIATLCNHISSLENAVEVQQEMIRNISKPSVSMATRATQTDPCPPAAPTYAEVTRSGSGSSGSQRPTKPSTPAVFADNKGRYSEKANNIRLLYLPTTKVDLVKRQTTYACCICRQQR